MTAKLGQPAKVQITSGRWSIAAVSKIVSGDTVNLVAFTDGVDPWPTIDTFNGLVAGSVLSATKGTGVGQWQDLEVPDTIAAAIEAAISGLTGFATEVYVDAGDEGRCAVPGPGSAVSSPALATSYHPDADRPVLVTVYCDVTLPSALIAAQSATVQLQAGSSTNPSTVVGGPLTPTNGALNPGPLTIPVTFVYALPANHYYQVVKTAGSGTVTITKIEETTL